MRINKSIGAFELRVIGSEGENLGVLQTSEALLRAEEAGLDLIEISPNARPPVAKIMDYGKYRYIIERKGRETKKAHQAEVRGIQIRLTTSPHDLEMKAKKASEFLNQGDRVRIDMMLKGREKYLDRDFLYTRLRRVLDFITVEYEIVEGPKKTPRGVYILAERKK